MRYLMGMKKMYVWIFIVSLASGLLAGCGKKERAMTPPTERNRLLIRLFQSIDSGDYAVSALQAEKFLALDPSNLFLIQMAEIQRGNLAVKEAQKVLDQGDIRQAIAILRRTQQTTPLHAEISQQLDQLQQLERVRNCADAYLQAKTLEERVLTLPKLEQSARGLVHPELHRHITMCRRKLNADVAAELKRRREIAEQRRLAEERAAALRKLSIEAQAAELKYQQEEADAKVRTSAESGVTADGIRP